MKLIGKRRLQRSSCPAAVGVPSIFREGVAYDACGSSVAEARHFSTSPPSKMQKDVQMRDSRALPEDVMPPTISPHVHRIFYVSRCLATPLQVEDILAVSRDHNALRDVTGALLFTGGCFAQVLEGDQSVLQTTMAAILVDPRHDCVKTLLHGDATNRRFAAWRMAYSESPGADDLLVQLLNSPVVKPARAERLLAQMFGHISLTAG